MSDASAHRLPSLPEHAIVTRRASTKSSCDKSHAAPAANVLPTRSASSACLRDGLRGGAALPAARARAPKSLGEDLGKLAPENCFELLVLHARGPHATLLSMPKTEKHDGVRHQAVSQTDRQTDRR